MKIKIFCSSFFALGALLASIATAQTGVQMGEPSFVGEGCGRGTASASISADGQTLSILFDDYIVEAGAGAGRRDRKACNVLIPIEVPRGYSVAVFKIDYRGFNALPAGAESQFIVDYFFGGRVGPRQTLTFQGPLEDNFLTSNNLTSSSVVWSPCGRSHTLRAHSVLKTKTNRQREQTLAAVDSADVQAGLTYHLQWRRCER